MRNAVGKWATGECFHGFFEFFYNNSIEKQRTFSIALENTASKKENILIIMIIKISILFACSIIRSTASASSVFVLSYRNMVINQSVHIFS